MEEKRLSTYNERGEEIPDSRPVSLHVKFRRQEPLALKIRRMVRSENLRHLAEVEGIDTFDEADDFDIPEDPADEGTPFEDTFDPTIPAILAREAEIRSGLVSGIPEDRILKAKELMGRVNAFRKKQAILEQKKQEIQEAEKGTQPTT